MRRKSKYTDKDFVRTEKRTRTGAQGDSGKYN